MKYVAFLDILGFKEKLRSISQDEATHYIGGFSSTAFFQWEEEDPQNLHGYIVSDSFIIYSNDASDDSLKELIQVVTNICKAEFTHNSIIMRGAIAKGNFDRLEAREISTLQKGLIVGQAYVDAYLLEGSVKTSGIILSSDVYEDLQNINIYIENVFEESIQTQKRYILRYLTLDYLLEENNLCAFIRLAIESKWLPHYYNTLYLALKREKDEKKVSQLFQKLIRTICNNNPSENWRAIDLFIRNSFGPDVIPEYQTRFLKHIRQRLFENSQQFTV